jgi:Lambda phage tail tube protein, TTP/Cadherin-like beta sandwich domain
MTQAYAWKSIVTTFTNAAGTSATVAEIKTVPAPQFTAEDIDVTNQDSGGVKEFIAGLKEGNEIEFIGNDVPSDTGQGLLDAAAAAGESGTFLLTFPSGRTITFTAAIKTFDIVEDNGAGAFSCKVKVSGTVTRGSTKIQLSALTTTAGTLFPTFAAGTYLYTVAAAHATATCTVTPTCATGTIKVNGTLVTSGQASGNITLTDAATTEIGILVTKTGSAATMYKLIVSRAAT